MNELLLFVNTAVIIYLFLQMVMTNQDIKSLERSINNTQRKVDDIISHIYKDYFSKIKK
jgi:cell division protein FtsL